MGDGSKKEADEANQKEEGEDPAASAPQHEEEDDSEKVAVNWIPSGNGLMVPVLVDPKTGRGQIGFDDKGSGQAEELAKAYAETYVTVAAAVVAPAATGTAAKVARHPKATEAIVNFGIGVSEGFNSGNPAGPILLTNPGGGSVGVGARYTGRAVGAAASALTRGGMILIERGKSWMD